MEPPPWQQTVRKAITEQIVLFCFKEKKLADDGYVFNVSLVQEDENTDQRPDNPQNANRHLDSA